MDVVDSSIRVIQTVVPSVMQYLGRAKDREANAAERKRKRKSERAKLRLKVIVM